MRCWRERRGRRLPEPGGVRGLRRAQGVPDAPRPAWWRLRGLDTHAAVARGRRGNGTQDIPDGHRRRRIRTRLVVPGLQASHRGRRGLVGGRPEGTGEQFPYVMPPVSGASVPWVRPGRGRDGPPRGLVRRRPGVRTGPPRLSARGAQSLPGDIPGAPGPAVLGVGTRRRHLTNVRVGLARRRGLGGRAPGRRRRAPQGRTSRVPRPGSTRSGVGRAGCPGRLLTRALPCRPQCPARRVGGPVRIGLAGRGTPDRRRLLPHRAGSFPRSRCSSGDITPPSEGRPGRTVPGPSVP